METFGESQLSGNVITDEQSVFYPNEDFRLNANMNDLEIYAKAGEDFVSFWEMRANKLEWVQKWHRAFSWKSPHSVWFDGGKINACVNCVDRHLKNGFQDKLAIIFENEQGEVREITYKMLFEEVCRFANVLKSLGVKKGDRVAIYLPLIPESLVSMLACARIGAPHVVVFGGIGVDGVKERVLDSGATIMITADGGFRRGKLIPYKKICDDAVRDCPAIRHVVTIRHTNQSDNLMGQKDLWYHELAAKESADCAPEPMESEDMLFILYTSGSTGRAKGIFHSTAGYLVGVDTTCEWVFDLKPNDIYWCTADMGWITGHSYVLYGPLSQGTTLFIYEGAPDYPDKSRFWKMAQQHKVTIFYTAPTTIRTFAKWGVEWIEPYDLQSLRLIGSIGEPINPEAWLWYHKNIGRERCPIVDTWFQTETGAHVITPLPGITPLKPGSVTRSFPGIEVAVLDEEGQEVEAGLLAIKTPYPSMLRGIYNDPERYKNTYWSKWNGKYYFTGDGAKRDADGYFWVTGRVDDVLKVSGHRIGSAEVESALVQHPSVAESSVIGVFDEIKGEKIVAFVILKDKNDQPNHELERVLIMCVAKNLGAYAKPEKIVFTRELPKTRSGKIMRRVLRGLVEKKPLGDVSTLENPDCVEYLKTRLV